MNLPEKYALTLLALFMMFVCILLIYILWFMPEKPVVSGTLILRRIDTLNVGTGGSALPVDSESPKANPNIMYAAPPNITKGGGGK